MGDQFCKKSRLNTNAYPSREKETSPDVLPNSMLESIARGTMHPTSEMLGRQETLAPSLSSQMSAAFGLDLSGLEVYRSETAKAAGFQGLASGNKVVLSPDIDLNSHSGQAVLGHELSHINAQAHNIGAQGRGIIRTSSLERQAMIEGERAASGMRAFAGSGLSMETSMSGAALSFTEGLSELDGQTLTPLSATTGAFGMGAPMQGKKDSKSDRQEIASRREAAESDLSMRDGYSNYFPQGFKAINTGRNYKVDRMSTATSMARALFAEQTGRNSLDTAPTNEDIENDPAIKHQMALKVEGLMQSGSDDDLTELFTGFSRGMLNMNPASYDMSSHGSRELNAPKFLAMSSTYQDYLQEMGNMKGRFPQVYSRVLENIGSENFDKIDEGNQFFSLYGPAVRREAEYETTRHYKDKSTDMNDPDAAMMTSHSIATEYLSKHISPQALKKQAQFDFHPEDAGLNFNNYYQNLVFAEDTDPADVGRMKEESVAEAKQVLENAVLAPYYAAHPNKRRRGT